MLAEPEPLPSILLPAGETTSQPPPNASRPCPLVPPAFWSPAARRQGADSDEITSSKVVLMHYEAAPQAKAS